MVFKNFHLHVAIRIIIISIALALFIYWLLVTGKYIRAFYMAVLVLLALIEFFIFINRTNRDVTNFFQSILSSDFTHTFSASKKGKTFALLYENMNKITRKFRDMSREKEIQYLYLQTLIDHANVGLISFNKEGSIQLANLAFRELLNVRPVPADASISDLPEDISSILGSLSPGERKLVSLKIREKMIPLIFIATGIKTEMEELILVSLQNIRQELDEKEMESWQKLIRVLTHEIMNSATPITSLSSSLFSMLEKNKGEPIGEKEIQKIINGLEAINDRSSGLMRFTQAYQALTRIPQPQVESIPIEKLIHRLEILAKAHLEEKKIQFHIGPTENLKDIHIDINLLDQVFLNLFKNSVEALDGRPDPVIKISFRKTEEEKVMIRFEDNGIGMSEEIREQIFIPFFTTKESGSGVGLSLCKQIIRLHGGIITVESEEKKGTSFILIL
jgi:signal transduction histidine kinase